MHMGGEVPGIHQKENGSVGVKKHNYVQYKGEMNS